MVSSVKPAEIADAFEKSGCDWILKYSDRDRILKGVAGEMERFRTAYHDKFKEYPDPFAMLAENRPRGAAFFQAFTGPPLSISVLIAIWRILLGSDIQEIQVHYQKAGHFRFQLVISTPLADAPEVYESDNPWDLSFFRHVGLLTVDGKLVLDGFYALKSG